MATLFVRAIVLYLALIFFTRAMGKRQIGQFQPYEFVMTMLIANLVAAPMSTVSTPLLHGLLPVAALFVTHSALTLASLRSDRMRSFLSGKPSVIVARGVWREKELKRLCLSVADVLEGLRGDGILDPTEAETVIVEANGTITAFARSGLRPATAEDAGVKPGYMGLPLTLVMDGRVQSANLAASGQSERWLSAQLALRGLLPEQAFFCSIDTQGIMTVQDRRGAVSRFRALRPEEVSW